MNKPLLISILSGSMLFAGIGHTQATKPIVRDGEIDGGARILQIYCPSGSRTTVRLYVEEFKQYQPGMTCIYKVDGSDMCQANWDHDEAAVEACNQQ